MFDPTVDKSSRLREEEQNVVSSVRSYESDPPNPDRIVRVHVTPLSKNIPVLQDRIREQTTMVIGMEILPYIERTFYY